MGGFDFTGRRVLVTGASHGIGFAVARAFAGAGAELAVLSSTADIGDAARIEADSGRTVRALKCDVTDREVVRRTVGTLGALDVLVSNAGLELITPLLEPGDEVERAFVRIIEVNVIGTYYVCRDAMPLMRRGGSIILTSSIWGKSGAADFSAYPSPCDTASSKGSDFFGFARPFANSLILAVVESTPEATPRSTPTSDSCVRSPKSSGPRAYGQRRLPRLGQNPRGPALAEGGRGAGRNERGSHARGYPLGAGAARAHGADDVASLYLFLASDQRQASPTKPTTSIAARL